MPALDHADVQTFQRRGFVVLESVFEDEDLAPLITEIRRLVDDVAQDLYRRGVIASTLAEAGFENRLARIARIAPEGATALEDRELTLSAPLFELMRHPKVLDRVACLVGEAILLHPAFHVHPRIPGSRAVPHQDNAYFGAEADDTRLVVCTIPLVDTTVHNGCLWVVPGRHREGVLAHGPRRVGDTVSLEIPAAELPEHDRVAIPLRRGSMLLMSSLIPHGSFVNRSGDVRWTVDFRYQSPAEPTGRWFEPGIVLRTPDGRHAEPSVPAWRGMLAEARAIASREPDRPHYRWSEIARGATNLVH